MHDLLGAIAGPATTIATWIAPAITMIAACVTAANLGARVTGWGFAIFVAGSIAWSVVGLSTGQTGLLLTNAFLTIVNLVGVWRWLGRESRREDGARAAAERSERLPVPSLVAAGQLRGAKVLDRDAREVGTVVDAMLRRKEGDVAYLVLAEGGALGVGERLRAIEPSRMTMEAEAVRLDLPADRIAELPELDAAAWPAEPPR
jgi:sporulation protein YlmC with PRC-barrel domain